MKWVRMKEIKILFLTFKIVGVTSVGRLPAVAVRPLVLTFWDSGGAEGALKSSTAVTAKKTSSATSPQRKIPSETVTNKHPTNTNQ